MTVVPAISVVMPVYNGAAFLAAGIDSIVAQTFGDFELIIVDDGSTDATPAMLRDYAARDSRIRILSQHHGGIVTALNHGCAAARGALIARIDADDVALPERFERQAALLAVRPEIALVGTAVSYIDGPGRLLGSGCRYPAEHESIVRSLQRGVNAIAHTSVMMRADAWRALGGYDPRFRLAEDFELWLRFAARFRFANLSDALMLQRSHRNSSGVVQRVGQITAYGVAMAVNRLRLAGHPDPVAGLDRLTLQDFDRLTFSPGELARLKLGAGELVLGLLRDGRADLEVEALGRSLVRPAQPAMLSDLAVALSSGTGRGRYSARKAQALALHFARTGRYWRSLDWLARAAWRHPWGPLGLAGGVARWLWTARHGKR